MAFDGITIAAIRKELADKLINGRLSKIAQPEPDELLLTIKTSEGQFKLVLSANPSLPLTYLTDEGKVSPMTAPGFCMLLRKHIQNGRILSVTQPDFERILVFEIEHLNELGDLCRKLLIVELMGKYSNIIFTRFINNDKSICRKMRLSTVSSESLPLSAVYVRFCRERTILFRVRKEKSARLLQHGKIFMKEF